MGLQLKRCVLSRWKPWLPRHGRGGSTLHAADRINYRIGFVNGVLPVTVLREHLGSDGYWQVAFRLLSTDDFEPEAEVGTVSIASFNNIVEPPQWKDWSGKVVWPNYKLGVWDPVKWVKFMEYFRAMEQTAPATYKGWWICTGRI